MAEITRWNTFTKEINNASARSQYFDENFYCKNCLHVFSAMTGNSALSRFQLRNFRKIIFPTHIACITFIVGLFCDAG